MSLIHWCSVCLIFLTPAAEAGKAESPAPVAPFVWGPAAPDADSLVFIDEAPTTLLPLYARTDADLRVQELLYDRLFYGTAIT